VKIQFFLEAGPARLPLFASPAAKLVAQHAACPGPARGHRPHGTKAETELSSSLAGKKTSPNLMFIRICSESKQKPCGIGVRILHKLGKNPYIRKPPTGFWIKTEPLTLASHQLTALPSEDLPSRTITVPTIFESCRIHLTEKRHRRTLTVSPCRRLRTSKEPRCHAPVPVIITARESPR
jgi:hypothetical protein